MGILLDMYYLTQVFKLNRHRFRACKTPKENIIQTKQGKTIFNMLYLFILLTFHILECVVNDDTIRANHRTCHAHAAHTVAAYPEREIR